MKLNGSFSLEQKTVIANYTSFSSSTNQAMLLPGGSTYSTLGSCCSCSCGAVLQNNQDESFAA